MFMSHRSARRSLPSPLLLLPLLAVGAFVLGGCGDDAATTETADQGPVAVSDAWVKASDMQMTGSFGVIRNTGDADLTLVSAQTSASPMTELHEVVEKDGQMVMQPKQGGFAVPAGGEHVLEPGADHIMIMQLEQPLTAGDDVDITLTFDDGTTYAYTAQVREADVGDETYVPAETPMATGQ
jgi:hypothetical protein